MDLDIDVDAALGASNTIVGNGLYSRILVMDEIDGDPVVTCTGRQGHCAGNAE